MNIRRLKAAIKRIKHLPKGKWLFLYITNKIKHIYYKYSHSTKVAFPSTIMLELTNHCNLHCTTCPREYDYGKQMDKGYIDVEKAKKVIDEVWPYLDSIGLTGMGETFLYKEIEQIADYIKSKNKGIIISLSTNAMIPDFKDRVSKIVGKVDTIQVSIDGLNDVYEQIRKNAVFEKLKENLRFIVDGCANTSTTLMLNMVVTKENFHQMHEMISFSENMGVSYLNFNLFNLSSVTNVEQEYYQFYKSEPFINEIKLIENLKRERRSVYVSNWDFKTNNAFRKCPFPWTHFYICWNGYVTPCCAKPFPKELHFGNVFEIGVLNCLNSDDFRKFREKWYKNQSPNFCNKCHFIGIESIDL